VNPLWLIVTILLALDVVGVPYAFWLPHREEPLVFSLARYARASDIWTAYYWTVYGSVAFILLALLLGVFKHVSAYQHRPLELPNSAEAVRNWRISFAISAAVIVIMFLQAGGTVPILSVLRANITEYSDAAILRTYFSGRVNESLYNINLLFVAPFNLMMAFFCLRGFWRRFFSLLLFVLAASFSLAKSQIAASLFVLVLFASLARPPKFRSIVVFALLMVLCIAPFYLLFAYATNLSEVAELLAGRIVYGQWAGLPYYFMLFKGSPQPLASLLPPYVQWFTGDAGDSPGRKVMIFMEPAAAMEGVAGNVPTFYVGEAYAVAGMPGVLAAPFLVAFELLLLAFCFRLLPKTPLVTIFYSWFLYKATIGLVGGVSLFLVSGFTIALAGLMCVVIVRVGGQPLRRA
jgi:hypothetical protein